MKSSSINVCQIPCSSHKLCLRNCRKTELTVKLFAVLTCKTGWSNGKLKEFHLSSCRRTWVNGIDAQRDKKLKKKKSFGVDKLRAQILTRILKSSPEKKLANMGKEQDEREGTTFEARNRHQTDTEVIVGILHGFSDHCDWRFTCKWNEVNKGVIISWLDLNRTTLASTNRDQG